MDLKKVSDERARLAEAAAKRYANRKQTREKKLDLVERVGVLGAAGPAAIRRTAHMTLAEGRMLLTDAAPVAEAEAPPSEGTRERRGAVVAERTLEAVVGGFDDSDHVNFLLRGIRAARAVCRLTQNGQAIGTGFLVAPGIILTNNHVIPSAAEAATFIGEFDYELDVEDQPRRPVVRFELDPESAFVTSDADAGLDYTFCAVRPTSIDGSERITTFGWLPMDPRRDKILEGEPAVIIQHPRGDPKRLCLFAAELLDRPDDYIHYSTDTDGGSSGSPVMNRGWQLIGLHHAATQSDKKRRGHFVTVNEGIRVSSIINSLTNSDRILEGEPAKVLAAISRPDVVADGRPQSPALESIASPANRRPGAAAPILERATVIGVHDASHFDGRDVKHQGYKSGFLGSGFSVPQPVMPTWIRDEAATRLDAPAKVELTYTHYSVVLSAARRLPIYTAANINGAESQELVRLDRRFEAADKWFYDPRVDQSLQLGPEVYDGTAFDFGHMVRREDPVWGDLNTARMANDDSFYMTNCAPQHSDLNQRSWLALENAVLQSARKNKVRISVFTGPVLSPQDPTIRGVQVPTAFWKIIAYRSGGKLRAHGFMQWQTELVEDVRRSLEAFDQLERAVEYQVPIRDIARDTSLDFGPLVAADEDLATIPERVGGNGTAGRARRRLDDRIIESLSTRLAAASADGDTITDDKEDAAFALDDTSTRGRAAAAAAAASNGGDGAAVDDMLMRMFDRLEVLLRRR